MSPLEQTDLTQSKQWLAASQRRALKQIIEQSFAQVDASEYIAKYFDETSPYERKLRLYHSDSNIVGYCLLTFTATQNCVVIRASAAFLPQYRQGGNTFNFSLIESFKAWLKHPWKKFYYADTMLSPAMYRAIAKNSGIIYPHPEILSPKILFSQFNPYGIMNDENGLRCLVKVDRNTNYSEQDLLSLKTSSKPEIKYYFQLNPKFNEGIALFVIIPVNLKQVYKTLVKKVLTVLNMR